MAESVSRKIRVWDPVKGLIGGSVLVVLALITSTKYLGLGLDTIESALQGVKVLPYDFLLKIVFTAITTPETLPTGEHAGERILLYTGPLPAPVGKLANCPLPKFLPH